MLGIDRFIRPYNQLTVANGQVLTFNLSLDNSSGFTVTTILQGGAGANIVVGGTNLDATVVPPGVGLDAARVYMGDATISANGAATYGWTSGSPGVFCKYLFVVYTMNAAGTLTSIVNIRRAVA